MKYDIETYPISESIYSFDNLEIFDKIIMIIMRSLSEDFLTAQYRS